MMYELKLFIKNFKRFFKFKYQKLTKGFDDRDTWALDYTFAEFILPRLMSFRQLNNGHPIELTEEQWNNILDKMIESFRMHKIIFEDDTDYSTLPKEARDQKWTEYQEGLQLFAKYFYHLWW